MPRGELAYRRRTGGRRPDSRCLQGSLRTAHSDFLHHAAKSASRKTPGIWAIGEPSARRGTHVRREVWALRKGEPAKTKMQRVVHWTRKRNFC